MTTTLAKILPAGKRWRELWLAQDISGPHSSPSTPGGHALTLSGAQKRTTANGVHFVAGVDTSNLKLADPYDAVNDWWVSLRFTLDGSFSSASATDQYLLGKYVDATNYLVIFLRASDGRLVMDHTEGGSQEIIVSAETSWVAGTTYHVLCSISTTNGKRLIIDGGTAVTEAADLTAISLIADITFGARDDGTSTEGSAGVLDDLFMGNDALGAGEETQLNLGVPPADAVNIFLLDEGRGTTANDRGSGADDATLDSSCEWNFGGTKQAVISFDSMTDEATTPAAVNTVGDISVVWVGKIKAVYNASITTAMTQFQLRSGNNNTCQLTHGGSQAGLNLDMFGLSVNNFGEPWVMDSYAIIIGTLTETDMQAFLNGASLGTDSGTRSPGDLTGTWYVGNYNNPGREDISKLLLLGLIEGALTTKEALNLSQYINNWLNLGLTI